jgi:hypothetical protein
MPRLGGLEADERHDLLERAGRIVELLEAQPHALFEPADALVLARRGLDLDLQHAQHVARAAQALIVLLQVSGRALAHRDQAHRLVLVPVLVLLLLALGRGRFARRQQRLARLRERDQALQQVPDVARRGRGISEHAFDEVEARHGIGEIEKQRRDARPQRLPRAALHALQPARQ